MRYSKSWTEALREVQEQVGVRKVDFADGVTPDIEPDIEEAKIPEGLSKEGAAEFMAAASAAKKAGKKTFKFGDKEYPVTIKVDIPTSKKEETDLDEKMFSGKGEFEVKYASSKKGPIKVSKFNTLKDAQKFLAQVKGEGMNGIISKGGKPVKEALDSDDKPTVKKVVKMLKKASQAHAGQADDLEKSMDEKKSDYEDQIKAFLSKGGKVKKHSPNKKKIDQVIKDFKKKYKHSLDTFRDQDKKDFENYLKNKKDLGEEVELEEHCGECGAMDHVEESDKAMMMKLTTKAMKAMPNSPKQKELIKQVNVYRKKLGMKPMKEETVNEKKGSDYDLYHKTFSGAMQHAYAQAKKRGYVVDKDDIDNKVATGPRKPSMGKTNRYILGTDKKQKLHVQVANLDNKRYELNMYIEEADPQSDIKKKVEKTAMKVAKDVVKSEAHDPKDYAKKVAAVNKMFKVKSPKELSPDQKKKYFNTLDRMHKAKGEKPEIGEDKIADMKATEAQRDKDAAKKIRDAEVKKKERERKKDKADTQKMMNKVRGALQDPNPQGQNVRPAGAKPERKQGMKNSFTPTGTFLEDTRVFMNGLWEKAANEADGMDMSGPPPVMGKKTMTKKSQDKVEINPKEEE